MRSRSTSTASRKRAREITWDEVLVEILPNPPSIPTWTVTPEHFIKCTTDEIDSFLDIFDLLEHKRMVLKRLQDCLKGAHIPTPSEMKWSDVPRILEGLIPKRGREESGVNENKCSLPDELLSFFNDENFRNVTEMEAVIRVAAVVLCAVKGLKVSVQVQPSIAKHLTFTDFLFVVTGENKYRAFIEVKKTAEYTSLRLELPSTAQALREAHILLMNERNCQDFFYPHQRQNLVFWSGSKVWFKNFNFRFRCST